MHSPKLSSGIASLVVIFVVFGGMSPSHATEKSNLGTLQLVQVLYRHGDRTPTDTYPTDPYKDMAKFWPEGYGQLTDRGKMQQYNLGRYFRERYHGFLAIKYSPHEVYAMSSDMDRTIMSAESNLAGLFPPVNKWNPNIDWQPIPIRTIPAKHDRYLHIHEACPKYRTAAKEFKNSKIVKKTNAENKEFIRFVAEKAGLNSNMDADIQDELLDMKVKRHEGDALDVESIVFLQDIFLVQSIHNLSLPGWVYTNNVLPKLNELQTTVSTWRTYTQEMKRLRGGPLLEIFLKNMQVKAGMKDGKPRKMYVYSAHDSTLVRLMNTMGIFQPHNPPYAAALIVELHKNSENGQYFVEILYRNDTTRDPYVLQYPKCGSPCLLNDLIELSRPLIPKDWERECKSTLTSAPPSPPTSNPHSGILHDNEDKNDYLDDEESEEEQRRPNTPVQSGFLSNTGILIFGAIFFAVVLVLWVVILRTYVVPPQKSRIVVERQIISKPTGSYFDYETI